MNKTVDECKTAWKSLRGSLRYHKSGKKKNLKSGSAANSSVYDEEHFSDENNNIDWEFSECLAFLKPNSEKRTTFSSNSEEFGNCTQQEQETPCSSYNFSPKPPKKDSMLENVATLTQTVTELIKINNETPTQQLVQQPPLSNYTLLANLDRVLKELPLEVVEDLGLSFQQQAIAELRKHRNV